ncbi:Glutathione S-transferase [Altererythrobacter xiamenensis]|uniref:Glutathione S-transferase n=1 Tax=Altererythrobacter xiamenensis TaxID=1316679 RepID=A0A1Y6FAG6_9SPHN|nr:glutathione S-transferase [Altererythrobacter xiamenensis]SMQ69393.1 Glutathione S-transferase [Altererythrobacter xiamenensis]
MPRSDDIILHHYDASPFSNKVRMLLGLKGLAWQSVVTPNMMPKPDLVSLTGGYRRAPVMQIGADIYCDSQVIMAEIERRFPEPLADVGPSWPINLWADRIWFQHSVAIIFGSLGDKVDPAFIEDREKLSGRPFDVKAMAAAAEPAKAQWRAQAGWIESALTSSKTDFLCGATATIADLAAYMNIWFLASVFPDMASDLLKGFDQLNGWRASIEQIGQGERQEISGADAIMVAAEAEPAETTPGQAEPEAGLGMIGEKVIVSADDYGRDPIAGELIACDHQRTVIRRTDSATGTVTITFPQVGFLMRETTKGA